ncbi:Glycerol-3-phosphate dehydrogenase [NAD(P)+] [hydrothermal vent metagenome]|uniref:Glycerol-3-phosphate dehydrogenase [NAD(P)+] n=1 Tax=hydrothermal vent metagenome TaxID=652676 RepID=A0A3B0ZXK0_9ZZZZ
MPNSTSVSKSKITIIGSGSWGSALALLYASNGFDVTLWSHNAAHINDLVTDKENKRYLAGIKFPDNIQATSNLTAALMDLQYLLVVVPSHAFRETLLKIKPLISSEQKLIWATKGLEKGSCKFLLDVAIEVLGANRSYSLLSGPNFAKEIAIGLPSAITVASSDTAFAAEIANSIQNSYMRAYTSDDMLGVQLGGAIKNVLAVAAGITDGLGFGANSRSALITRGLHEMMRLGVSFGAQKETLMGLSGLGDLILTCTDDQSRNRRLGLAIGQGKSIATACEEIGQVVEGINTAAEVYRLAQQKHIDMPIAQQVYQVLHHQLDPKTAVQSLLMRDLKAEID